MEQWDRISQDPEVMGGKACIRDTRVTVGTILGQIGAGYTIEVILADYPYLESRGHIAGRAIRFLARQ